ncbi:MAG: Zn-dependent hydrolase, partial [Syntrophomonas sp.]
IKRLMSFHTRILGIPNETVWTGSEITGFYQRALDSARTIFDDIARMLNDGWEEENIKQSLFPKYYQGNLRIYTEQNITTCLDILLRRVKECL